MVTVISLSVPFSRLYKGEVTCLGLGWGMIWESFLVQSFKVAREWINDSLTWNTVFVGSRLGSGEEGPLVTPRCLTFCKFSLTFLHFTPFCTEKK